MSNTDIVDISILFIIFRAVPQENKKYTWQETNPPPKEAGSFSFTPMVDSRLKDNMISRVAAATVKLIESSLMRYRALGITAIGHREQTELLMYGEWSDDQIKNSHESLSTSISSPYI